jgi:hypothetical protein
LKKIAPDYYDNLPCHHSWFKVLIDFICDPNLGPKSRIRRSMRSDALKAKNAIDLKSKSKVNDVLHDVIDSNNNTTHLSKEERKLQQKKLAGQSHEIASSVKLTNGQHPKAE